MARGKYKEWLEHEKLVLLEGWARDGLTLDQIAHNIGITTTTLHDWKNKYVEISNAIKKGKEVSDFEVESALYRRAIGYEYEEVMTEVRTDETGNQEKHVRKTKKFMPPDVTAQIFWLKNRKPDKWRDKQVIEANAEGQLASLIDGLKEPEKKEGKNNGTA